MKKLLRTLSAALLAATCLAPGMAFADGGVNVSLGGDGVLKASDAGAVHSMLVELAIEGDNAGKVTDVALKDVPSGVVSSAVYDDAAKKATIAFSSGTSPLQLSDGKLGTVDVIAEGASAETPVPVSVRLVSMEYIDSEDASSATKGGSVDASAVSFGSTESVRPDDQGPGTGSGSSQGDGSLSSVIGGSGGSGSADGSGSGGNGSSAGAGGSSAGNGTGTTTADYKANGVVSNTQTGQSTANGANTGLVKTGDVVLISAIAIGVAAVCVIIGLGLSRKKKETK